MLEWLTFAVLGLSTTATALSWWEGRVRRRATRDGQQSSDNEDHTRRIRLLEESMGTVRTRTHDLANGIGRLTTEAAMRDEHAREYRDRTDRELQRLWDGVQRGHRAH